jgi:hypothetical protein
MTGSGTGHLLARLTGAGAHDLLPARPLGVADQDCDGRPEGATMTDAAKDLDLVSLDGHALSPPVSMASARELEPKAPGVDLEAFG